MNAKASQRVTPILLISLTVLLSTCAKMEPEQEKRARAADESVSSLARNSMPTAVSPGASDLERKKGLEPLDLGTPLIAPQKVPGERMLEYSLSLTYEVKDFLSARSELLSVAWKYGYISSASTSAAAGRALMNAELRVRSADLYDTLKALDSVGILTAESLRAFDHTEEIHLQGIRLTREQIRAQRRGQAAAATGTGQKNYVDIERSLSESEDRMDQAAHEQWKLKDRIAWAKIHVCLNGPSLKKQIEVPEYYNAFIDLVNMALYLVYALIVMVPLFIIAVPLWLKRKAIRNFFSAKKE